ncbi:hypothetical protein Q9299_05650 [Gemmobacter fulvus]|uniref:hypothetical protein n=1 Tax=Gemmobacter fulvus TaxID=2840474 RepID=UPI0027967CCF|nr:hypothetical protein [Gemmobacter fulvus]MDQ1847769.1 hypothetical protein [Gemmobacter fulvus]
MDKKRFLEELDFITDKCARMAQEYASLRGAMASLDGLENKCSRQAPLKQSTIRFFNETKNLRVSRIVSVVWALSERAGENKRRQSSLSCDDPIKPPTKLDSVKFSGDMTLMRLRDMYRKAVRDYPDIILEKIMLRHAEATQSELSKLAATSNKTLSDLCERIDQHLSDDGAWHKIEHFRHAFSHSLRFSKISIDNDWISKSPDYSYNDLYAFGDRAAQIAIEFIRVWTISATYSGVQDIADLIQEQYGEFWADFFGNPLFYDE